MLKHLNSFPQKPKRVVILGSGGFIGKHLEARLKTEGINVCGIRSTDLNLCSPDSSAALQTVLQSDDALVIASAITPDRGKDTMAFIKNIQMIHHVEVALSKTSCSHAIYLSSDAVFAENLPPIDEKTDAAPTTLPGKACNEIDFKT